VKRLLAIALAACAPAAPPAKPLPPAPKQAADAGFVDMTPAKGADVPSLDELAARGATDAPLMREVKRLDDVSKPTELEAGAADACFRAVVAASAPVKAWFIDATNAPRGEIAESAGLVPPRGPVCAKKGETLRLVVLAPTAGTTARAVVWQSP
jgi:hypothetical protein